MNLGRNDPCLCGSGKKYKQCCLFEVEASSSKQRRQRLIEEKLAPRLLDYAFSTFGPSSLHEAWKQFNDLEEIEELEDGHPMAVLFIPWYLYYWEVGSKSESTGRAPIAESFRVDHEEELTKEEIDFLDATIGAPYSLHEIINVKPGISLKLRDLFTRAEHDVLESEGSKTWQPGEILYCATIEVDESHLLLGCGPFELESNVIDRVMELRTLIAGQVGRENLDEEDLVEAADYIRTLYLNLVDELLVSELGLDPEMLMDETHRSATDSEQRREVILEIVDNQIKAGDPPETKETLERLIKAGYSMQDAKELIAHVVAAEIFNIMNEQQPFNVSRFVEGLDALPKLPE